MNAAEEPEEEEEQQPELYRDCEWFHERCCSSEDGDDYVYAPRCPDADLDAELFRELTAQCRGRNGTSDPRRIVEVFVPGDDKNGFHGNDGDGKYKRAGDIFNCETASVGHVFRESLPRCEACRMVVPADLDYFYVAAVAEEKSEERLLCRVCFQKQQQQPALRVERCATGLENASDWIELCTIQVQYLATARDPFSARTYFYTLLCNLNRASRMHGRFALQYYVSGIGDCLDVQPETTTLEQMLVSHGSMPATAAVAGEEK